MLFVGYDRENDDIDDYEEEVILDLDDWDDFEPDEGTAWTETWSEDAVELNFHERLDSERTKSFYEDLEDAVDTRIAEEATVEEILEDTSDDFE